MRFTIPPEAIAEYVYGHFYDYKYYSSSNELTVASPFLEGDEKYKLSINMDTGLWRCFVTGRKGNIFQLYMILEDTSYKKALDYFSYKILENIDFDGIEPERVRELNSLNIPSHWVEITVTSYDSDDPDVREAFMYILNRKLFSYKEPITQRYFIVKEPKTEEEELLLGRVIIPIIDSEEMYFYSARSLHGQRPKYIHSETLTKPSNILYPFNYDRSYVIIAEGLADAIALQTQGLNATCVFGASVSDIQLNLLQQFGGDLVAGFDSDMAGQKALKKLDKSRKLKNINDLYILELPDECKDWAEAHEKNVNLNLHFENNVKPYDFYYITLSSLV